MNEKSERNRSALPEKISDESISENRQVFHTEVLPEKGPKFPWQFPFPPYLKKLLLCGALIVGSAALLVNGADTMSKSARDAYDAAKEEGSQTAYNNLYNHSFDAAEANVHVANHIAISVAGVQEAAELEVLRVSDVEYVTMDKEDSAENVTSWLEVPGTGVFTVDLASGEYIVDSQRQHVLARVPRPVLSEFTVDYTNVKQLLWIDDVFDGSIKAGEDMARELINQGSLQLRQYMTTNRMVYESVTASAQSMIDSLVRQFNPDARDLVVEVEFLDGI